MKVKKIVCMILAIVMMCTAFMSSKISLSSVIAAEVEDTEIRDTVSGDYQYKVLNNGTAEITKYTGSALSLTIPSKLDGYSVTSIGSSAFENCENLTSVSIPDRLTTICESAFFNCKSLVSINIPNNLESLGDLVFAQCESLVDITLPNSLKAIPLSIFYCCTSLKSVIIPSSVRVISTFAFMGCSNLKSIYVPKSVNEIDDSVFSGCEVLSDVYFEGTKDDWDVLHIGTYNSPLINANIHYETTQIPQGISVITDKTDVVLDIGESITINTTVKGGDLGYTTEWNSSDETVAVVDQKGNVTAKGKGTAEVTVTAQNPGSDTDISKATVKITVKQQEKQKQTISLSKTSYTKTYGNKPFNLSASAMTSLQYKSSNTKVATVSSNGTVTIKGSGSATITITAVSDEQYNSAERTVKITVNKAAQKITAKSFTKTYGSKAFSLGAKTSGDGKLTYTTSNKNIATVSSKGMVSIKGCGKATITINASTTSKYKSVCKKVYITVLPSNVQITSLTGKGNTAKMTFKKQQGLSGYVVEISRKSNFSFKASNILKGSKGDCNFNGCTTGKKYYVRIRAFVKINGHNYYSKWSTRSVIIKR